MLNRCYFLDEGGRVGLPGDLSIPVAHVVDGRPGQIDRLLEHHYSAEGNYPFCLVLSGDDPAVLARSALLLFFHPGYVVSEQGKPVFLQGSNAVIDGIFEEQRLEVEVVALEAVKMLNADGHDPAGDYYRYCLTSYAPGDVFMLSGDKVIECLCALERVDKELAASHERWYRLATESRAAGLRAAAQEREIGRLREEKKIMQELLELSNKHDEVNYILKFYRNEYEILPLWYKRLGHIIKVIQGKRSFRSLFDKRVKKYKD